jgi:hypothetical protein
MEQKDFDLAMGIELFADEAGRDDFGVIADQDIARKEIIDDVMKNLVLDRSMFAVDHHESGLIALL